MSLSARLYFHVELRASDPQPIGFQPAELRDHLFRQTVTQVFLVRIAGEVVEGKNGERQPPARPGPRSRTRCPPSRRPGPRHQITAAMQGRAGDERRDGTRTAGAARARPRPRRLNGPLAPRGRGRHRSDEPVTTPREGLDVTGGLGRVAQRLPQLPHRRVEAVVEVDERVRRPELLPQLLSGHHLARALQEQGQQVEKADPAA